MKRKASLALLLAVCSCNTGSIWAKMSAPEMLPEFHVYATRLVGESHVAGKTAVAIEKVPASVTVIDGDEMQRLGVYNLTDALEYNAGITVAPRGYDPLYNFSKIRGFDVGHTNVLVDGMKAFESTDNLFAPEMYGMEQVEILRGPASTLYGAGSAGGTLLLRTKRPQVGQFSEARILIGNDRERSVALDINGDNGDGTLQGRLVANWKERDLFYDQTQQKRYYIAPSFTKQWQRTTLTVLPFYQKDTIDGNAYLARVRLYGDPLYNVLPDRFFVGVNGWDRYESRQKGISYELKHAASDRIIWHQKGSLRDTDIISRQTMGVFGPLPGPDRNNPDLGINRIGAMFDSQAKSYSLDQFAEIRGTNSTTVFGAGFRYETIKQNDGMRMLTPWPIESVPFIVSGDKRWTDGNVIVPMGSLRYWSHERGIYFTHRQEVGRWSLSAGIRKAFYDRHSDRDEQEFNQQAWTGQIGVVYGIGKGWSTYLHWNNSFEPIFALNKDRKMLDPMTGREWEWGIRYRPNVSTLVTASLFDLRRQNVPQRLERTPYYRAIGEMTSQGVELEGRMTVGERLRLLGSYTYLDARVTKDQNRKRIGCTPAGVARHSANLRADIVLRSFADGEWTLGIGARFIGQRKDESNERTLGGSTLYDASLSYYRNNHEWTVHARNLFNKKYLTSVEEMWGVPTGFAGQERSWLLTYTTKW